MLPKHRFWEAGSRQTIWKLLRLLVRPEGFEPPTPKFEVWCSIQLSYGRREAQCSRSHQGGKLVSERMLPSDVGLPPAIGNSNFQRGRRVLSPMAASTALGGAWGQRRSTWLCSLNFRFDEASESSPK